MTIEIAKRWIALVVAAICVATLGLSAASASEPLSKQLGRQNLHPAELRGPNGGTLPDPLVRGGMNLARNVPIVSPRGVGRLRLGATARALHRRHLIRGLRPGCELAPDQRVARLRPPLNGFAIFSRPNRRLSSIVIDGGAQTARGIGIGSTPGEARNAYPSSRYEPPGTALPFDAGFIWIDGPSGPKMTFVVDPETELISSINVPAPNFCE